MDFLPGRSHAGAVCAISEIPSARASIVRPAKQSPGWGGALNRRRAARIRVGRFGFADLIFEISEGMAGIGIRRDARALCSRRNGGAVDPD